MASLPRKFEESTAMPRTITITVYDIHELQDCAREAAREWYRQDAFPHFWHDHVIADFTRICEILGIRLRSSKNCRQHVFFSGFHSQGDGASFEGQLHYASGCRQAIRDHAPDDSTLHDIADRIFDVQRRNFYQLIADISHCGRYYHEYTMRIDIERDSPQGHPPTPDAHGIVQHALRNLARWLYHQLKTNYEYMNIAPAVDEGIAANDWQFTDDGRFCRHAL